jgi:hypothetical protein
MEKSWAANGPKNHKKNYLKMEYCGWGRLSELVYYFNSVVGLKGKLTF